MSEFGPVIDAMLTALEAAAPGRKCTREYRDHADRPLADMKAGVFTLLHKSGSESSRRSMVEMMLVGQIRVGEKDTGAALDEAEELLLDEARRFTRNIRGVKVAMQSWRKSMQMEKPFGWVSLDLSVGPLDLSPASLSQLGDFITYHAEHDIGADNPVITEETLPQG